MITSGIAQTDFQDPPWKYSLEEPSAEWMNADYDDALWKVGAGGFGDPSTPGSRVSTEWTTNDIWLRRTVNLDAVPQLPALMIHHDEDVEVFINGTAVVRKQGFITRYEVIPLNADSVKVLKKGQNLIAVHCHQTNGGQFIDVHLVDARNPPKLPAPKPKERPFQSKLITPWGEEVTPENAWQEYPRPAFQRSEWKNLNGLWDYSVTDRSAQEPPAEWTGQILVPFAPESALSGVQKLIHDDKAFWYKTSFAANPADGKRILLNFEAVDYRCEVLVNEKSVGKHQGGNTPFQLDITEAVKQGDNTLIVRVEDDTERSQLRGKQSLRPNGIWYTQVSGIWQTVWLETVAATHISDLKITTDAGRKSINTKVTLSRTIDQSATLVVTVLDARKAVAEATMTLSGKVDSGSLNFEISDAKLWSPASPHLYDIRLRLQDASGHILDEVSSYAGIRTVGREKDSAGHWRFTLNSKPIFHWGPLDQGWWPDGLLTPPSDAAMLSDIRFLKDAGFNMIRKHIKVEPRRYYTYCDQLGMLVWQDQVSGGAHPPWTRLDPNPVDAEWTDADHAQFMQEFEWMVDLLENHPSIVVWTPFNEAWGQHRTLEVGNWILKRDPTRHVNIASGGNFWPSGHIVDEHRYPHPGFPFDSARDRDFIKVVGEFGGHGLPVEGHLWDPGRGNWGYGDLPKDSAEYQSRYRESLRLLTELKGQGIAAGVYTQTTDVEGEINGLMTYDRRVIKIPADELQKLHQALFAD
ncbi:MAG: hypothetical protein JNL58_17920 [Planctomyces sp.]|nr:hypothetical protein [Planctomyces sp.]